MQREKSSFCLFRFRGGRAFVAMFLVIFLLGHNLTVTQAQTPPPLPAGTEPPPPLVPAAPSESNAGSDSCVPGESCEAPGTTQNAATFLTNDLLTALSEAASGSDGLEQWLFTYLSDILESEYDQLAWLENEMIDWWNTMWYYNLLPGLQSMARQLNIDLALQALQMQENADVSSMQTAERTLATHGITDQQMLSPEEQVCVAATGGGGLTRASAFGRAMRHVWETQALMGGLNTILDVNRNPNPGAASAAGSDQKRYQDWQNVFCDPLGFSVAIVPCGKNVDTNLTNADVLPVKYLFNNLTINVDDKTQTSAGNGGTEGQNLERAVEYLINNLVGLPAMDAVTQAALTTPVGEEGYLTRRSYLARYAAIRSVPDMVAGWRMPGSQMSKWIADLRENSGVSANLLEDSGNANGLVLADGISNNPSYKEIMHALSVDRFNSGIYATEMITDPAKVEQEKLQISAFYLMQLRDYYELLERTALTLAVQVSLMDDQQSMANANSAAPTQ